jgi:hypothetical protein
MVSCFKCLKLNLLIHNDAKPEKTMFFNKKIYKGLYKVKMDIYKCPNPKKFLKYILEKREIITFKLLLRIFILFMRICYHTW